MSRADPAQPPPGTLVAAAVFAGGAVGTGLRWAAVATLPGRAVLVVLVVNLVGSLLLATLWPWPATPLARAFVHTGLLGSLTTFSTLVVDAVLLVQRDAAPVLAAAYLLVSLVGGLALAAWGRGRAIGSRRGAA